MRFLSLLVCACALLACTTPAAWTASAASTASASGTLTITRPAVGAIPAGTAQWNVDGAILGAHAEAAVAGAPSDPRIHDSDSRYVHATLVTAHQDTVTSACDDMGGTNSVGFDGVATSSAITELDVTLNQLSGRGYVTFGIAANPYSPSIDATFLPGQTTYTETATCYGQSSSQTFAAPTVGGNYVSIFSAFMAASILQITWPILRARDGTWRLSATRHATETFKNDVKVKASLSISGTGVSMHALCHSPTPRDLYPARTLTAAKRIMARAGFPRMIFTSPQRTRAAKKGHYYVSNMIGNRNPLLCASRGLKLTKSLGW